MATKTVTNKNISESSKESDVECDDSDDESLSADNDNLEESDTLGNFSWANAISKVLYSKGSKNGVILSKAKKDKEINKVKNKDNDNHGDDNSIEIVADDGTVKKYDDINDLKSNVLNDDAEKAKKKAKREWEMMMRVKPHPNDKEKERMLTSIATKGVVQLFNAVLEQQRSIESRLSDAGPSETKRDRVMSKFTKRDFLDKLKKKRKVQHNEDNKEEDKSDKQKWKVLRDDFMVGAKMKDWDRESDSGSD